MKKNNKQEYAVIQSNPLVEGQYKLDVLPQKIVRHLVSLIKPEDSTFTGRIYHLKASDFTTLIGRGYDGKAIEDIKAAAEKLLKTQITIRRGKEFTRTNWIASYKHHIDEGWFEFSFSVHLERELLKIREQFTQYHLENVSKLKSQYSIRLYELLKQYLAIGNRKINLADLKGMLGIVGNEYVRYVHFTQRVLQPAHKEINAKTDLEYQWEPDKHIRKVVGIKFYDIRTKAAIPIWVVGLLPSKHRGDKNILKNIRRWLDLRDAEYVKEKIQYTASRNPENFGDYLFRALEKNYGEGFDPDQPGLFPEGEKVGYPIREGMKIEVNGITYSVEDGRIITDRGVIPEGDIIKGLVSGKFKEVVDV